MKKKTLVINEIFTGDVTLMENLERIVNEGELDQQDVIDIADAVSVQYRKLSRVPGRRFGGAINNTSPLQLMEQESCNYSSDEHPEYFNQVLPHLNFTVMCMDVVLKDDFKFTGVKDGNLLYLGRDGETCELKAIVMQDVYGFRCGVKVPYSRMFITCSGLQISNIKRLVDTGEITLPGQPKLSPNALRIKKHYALSEWRNVSQGSLVKDVYNPNTIYLVVGADMYSDGKGMIVQEVVIKEDTTNGLDFVVTDNPPLTMDASRLTPLLNTWSC